MKQEKCKCGKTIINKYNIHKAEGFGVEADIDCYEDQYILNFSIHKDIDTFNVKELFPLFGKSHILCEHCMMELLKKIRDIIAETLP